MGLFLVRVTRAVYGDAPLYISCEFEILGRSDRDPRVRNRKGACSKENCSLSPRGADEQRKSRTAKASSRDEKECG